MKQWFQGSDRHPWMPTVAGMSQWVEADRFVPPTAADIPGLDGDDDHRGAGEGDFSHCIFRGSTGTTHYYVDRPEDGATACEKVWHVPLGRRSGDRPEWRRVASVRCVKALLGAKPFHNRAIAGPCIHRE
jgi:hypothetical protein